MADQNLKYTITVDEKGAIKSIKSFEKAGTKSTKNMDKGFTKLSKTSKKTTNTIAKHWKALGATMLAALAFKEIIDGFKSVIKVTSDLQEVTGKFEVVFKDQMVAANKFVDVLVDGYAMSTREARQFLSSIQDLLVPMGVAADEAAILSNEVVQLAADLGSFNNLPTQKVIDDMQSALVGNYETMKKYGVVLKATTVEEKALAMGLAATKKQLTAAHKAQAAYRLMVEGSAAAIGDMGRTMGNYANQVKQFNANLEQFKVLIGKHILPKVNEVITSINEWYKANEDLIDQNVGDTVKEIYEALKRLAIFVDENKKTFELIGKLMGLGIKLGIIGQINNALIAWENFNLAIEKTKVTTDEELELLSKIQLILEDQEAVERKITRERGRLIVILENEEKFSGKFGWLKKGFEWPPSVPDFYTGDKEDAKKQIVLLTEKLDFLKEEANLTFEALNRIWNPVIYKGPKGPKPLKPADKDGKDGKGGKEIPFDLDDYLNYLDKAWNAEVDQANKIGELTMLEQGFKEEAWAKEKEFKKYMDDQILDMNAERLSKQIGQEEEAAQRIQDMQTNLAVGIADSFTSVGMSIRGVIQDTMEWADVIENTLNSLSDAFMQYAMDMIKAQMLMKLAGIVVSGISGAFGSGAGAGANTIRGGEGGGYGFAKGGVAMGGFRPFANGGIADRPTMGLIGEGGMNEAVVPLPDGKSIPVEGGGGTTNIIIQALDSQSFFDAMRRNPEAIINVISEETDKGNNKLMSSINRAGAFA